MPAASILEPELPAGGIQSSVGRGGARLMA